MIIHPLPYTSNTMYTTDIKRNNPGNIRPSKIAWAGEQTRKGQPFCEFVTIEYGCRAMLKLLTRYIDKHKLRTSREIISRWAPPTDGNNTEGYIQAVARLSGIKPNVIISHDQDVLISLAMAMTQVEHAGKCPPLHVWQQACMMF